METFLALLRAEGFSFGSSPRVRCCRCLRPPPAAGLEAPAALADILEREHLVFARGLWIQNVVLIFATDGAVRDSLNFFVAGSTRRQVDSSLMSMVSLRKSDTDVVSLALIP